MRSLCTPVALVSLLVACGTVPTDAPRYPRGTGNILTGAELEHPVARNAYDLIRLLRPMFFQARSPSGLSERAIYIDGMHADRADDLRLVPADVIVEIRLLSAPDATFRYGLDHSGGAIVVTTRVPPRRQRGGCRRMARASTLGSDRLALRTSALVRRDARGRRDP
jgi:hypothetical protein